MIAEVIPRLRSIRKLQILDYHIPYHLPIHVGMSVEVPFRSKKIPGVVVKIKTISSAKGVREITRIISDAQGLSPVQIELMFHLAAYTHAPLSTALQTVMAEQPIRKGKKTVAPLTPALTHAPTTATVSTNRLPLLKKTLQTLVEKKGPLVLRYSEAAELIVLIRGLVKRGGPQLILVPHEGSLTYWSQILKEFDPVIIRSQLSKLALQEIWQKAQSGQPHIFIGTRRAIFLPPDAMRSIVVLDEHDESYHQGQNPRYDARDLAGWLSKKLGIPCVFASPAPRIVSTYRFPLLDIALPPAIPAHIVNLHEWWTSGGTGICTQQLLDWIETKSPTVVVFNRRGMYRLLKCSECKLIIPLPHPGACPHCHSLRLQPIGIGTQRIVEVLRRQFPDRHIERWDADSLHAPPAADILVSTSYGLLRLDWKHYASIAVISVDHQLSIPDFRSTERVFSFLTNLVRTNKPVLLQTASPDHPAIQLALRQEFGIFYEQELATRKKFHYPPFGIVASIIDSARHTIQTRKYESLAEIPPLPEGQILDIIE